MVHNRHHAFALWHWQMKELIGLLTLPLIALDISTIMAASLGCTTCSSAGLP